MTPSNDESLGFDSYSDTATWPPADLLFEALTDSKRRQLLAVLSTTAERSLDELTDVLVGIESATEGPADPDNWQRVRIELVHRHLPLLTEAGLVTYEDDTVRREECPVPVEDLLAFAGEYDSATPPHPRHG
jgi:predicted transcriptional regulator